MLYLILCIIAYATPPTLSNSTLSPQPSPINEIIDWNSEVNFNNKDIYKSPRNVYTSVGNNVVLECGTRNKKSEIISFFHALSNGTDILIGNCKVAEPCILYEITVKLYLETSNMKLNLIWITKEEVPYARLSMLNMNYTFAGIYYCEMLISSEHGADDVVDVVSKNYANVATSMVMPTLLTSSNQAYEIEHGEEFYLSCYMFVSGVPSCLGMRMKCGDYYDKIQEDDTDAKDIVTVKFSSIAEMRFHGTQCTCVPHIRADSYSNLVYYNSRPHINYDSVVPEFKFKTSHFPKLQVLYKPEILKLRTSCGLSKTGNEAVGNGSMCSVGDHVFAEIKAHPPVTMICWQVDGNECLDTTSKYLVFTRQMIGVKNITVHAGNLIFGKFKPGNKTTLTLTIKDIPFIPFINITEKPPPTAAPINFTKPIVDNSIEGNRQIFLVKCIATGVLTSVVLLSIVWSRCLRACLTKVNEEFDSFGGSSGFHVVR